MVKEILNRLKEKITFVWDFYRLQVYIACAVLIVLFILSFFIQIGYVLTILAVVGLMQYSTIVSKEDPDVLKVEKNDQLKEQKELEHLKEQLSKELVLLEKYIKENPTDFVAWRRKAEIEEFLKEF